MTNIAVEGSVPNGVSRRELLATAGKAGALLTIGAALPGCGGGGTGGGASSDMQRLDRAILNFALQLEYLEAEFLSWALNGRSSLSADFTSGVGERGPTTGGSQVALGGEVRMIFEEVLQDDLDHIAILRSLLASEAVAKPAINLNALDKGFSGQAEFISVARAIKDLIVTAHANGAPLIQTELYRQTATKIGFTEAYHAGNIRLVHIERGAPETRLDAKDQRIKEGNYFSTGPGGQMIQRTIEEVFAVIFQGNEMQGGFFPQGLNGIPENLPSS